MGILGISVALGLINSGTGVAKSVLKKIELLKRVDLLYPFADFLKPS